MLSMLGWNNVPQPLGKKAQLKAQKSTVAHVPRTIATQTHALPAQTAPTYYAFSSTASYVLDSQRPQYGYTGQPATKNAPVYAQGAPSKNVPASSSTTRPEYMNSSSVSQTVSGDRSDPNNGAAIRSFKILPTHDPDAFIYARSEDARSDTLTNYSSSSLDTTTQSMMAATSNNVSRPEMTGRRSSVLMITNAGPGDVPTSSSVPSPPPSPQLPTRISPPSSSSSATVTSNSQGRTLSRGDGYVTRPRSGSGDSSSSRRRGSGSDSERPTIIPPGPSPSRSSPPRANVVGRIPERQPRDSFLPEASDSRPPYGAPGVPPTSTVPPLHPPRSRRDSDSRMQVDAPRSRRLSNAVIPPGYGPGERSSPPGAREVPPLGMRSAPSSDGKRERYSPEREVSPNLEVTLERKVSNSVPIPQPQGGFFERERPQVPKHQYPSMPRSGSVSPRERQSPQEEVPRSAGFMSGPPATTTIRSRTLSSSRRDEAPRQIVIAGMDMSIQGPNRTVRFSERLICPSPVPLDKRRKGWFNKRGDQLWTNDGVFVPVDPEAEYPIDLNEYPDVGTGWMNEEGIRIDMQHRLVPKPPLRPALKRSSTSSSTASITQQQQQMAMARPENRYYSSTSIREEI
ncbi:hypothetical protein M0805_002790 [Coniferiporia weirii]|nr:hypothetical protein M0805_002790 [Coniferiporia weirii]